MIAIIRGEAKDESAPFSNTPRIITDKSHLPAFGPRGFARSELLIHAAACRDRRMGNIVATPDQICLWQEGNRTLAVVFKLKQCVGIQSNARNRFFIDAGISFEVVFRGVCAWISHAEH